MPKCRRIGNQIEYADCMYAAVLDADVLLVVTEWKEFRMPSCPVLKKTMNTNIVIDGRNIYESTEMQKLDMDYSCIDWLLVLN